jgi:hypothetical protein
MQRWRNFLDSNQSVTVKLNPCQMRRERTPRDLDMGFRWIGVEIRLNFDFPFFLLSFFPSCFFFLSQNALLGSLDPKACSVRGARVKSRLPRLDPDLLYQLVFPMANTGITVFFRETLASSGLPSQSRWGVVGVYTAPKSEIYGVRIALELRTRVRHGDDPAGTSSFTDEPTTASERFTACDRPPRWADNVRARRSRSAYDDNQVLRTPEEVGSIRAKVEQYRF